MKLFDVSITETLYYKTTSVVAKNKEEAIDEAYKQMEDGMTPVVNGGCTHEVNERTQDKKYKLNKTVDVGTPEFEQLLEELCDTFDVELEKQ